jgi:hypothetical protein
VRLIVSLPACIAVGFTLGFVLFSGPPAPASKTAAQGRDGKMIPDTGALPDYPGTANAKAERLMAAAMRKGDRSERDREMHVAVDALTADDFRRLGADADALKAMAEKLKGNDWRTNRDLLGMLLARWLKLDPGGMTAWAPQALEFLPKGQLIRLWVLDELGAKQFPEMLALAQTRKDPSEREEIIARALRELTLRDPAKGRAWLAEFTDDFDQRVADKAFRMGIVQADPLRAIELVGTIKNQQDGYEVLRLAVETAARMGTGVLRQLATAPMKSWMLPPILNELADRDPETALDLALNCSAEGNARSSALRVAFAALAKRNEPAECIAKLEGLEGEDREAAVFAISSSWMQRDAVAAMNWLAETPPSASRSNLLVSFFAPWVSNAESNARLWAEALPSGEARDAVQTQLARSLAGRGKPDEAMQILARLGRAADPRAIAEITTSWAQSDPQAAANWAIAQEPGLAQSRALAGIVRTWADDDEQSVANWLAQFPPGDARDRSISAFLFRNSAWNSAPRERIAEFDAWFDLIDDPWQRALAARSSFSDRARLDPAAARAWLAALPNVDAEIIRGTLRDSAE